MIKIVTSVMIVLLISTISGNAMYAFAQEREQVSIPQHLEVFDPVCPDDCADLALERVFAVDPFCFEVAFDGICEQELIDFTEDCLETADIQLCEVGGELIPIDSTALILAGAQTSAVWMISALAVIGSVAFGALYLTTRRN